VELRLPAEVTGFPCLMRRLKLVRVANTNQNQNLSKGQQLLQKSVRWGAETAEKAMQREMELLKISTNAPPDSAFTLDKTFAECPNLYVLEQQFASARGHGWD